MHVPPCFYHPIMAGVWIATDVLWSFPRPSFRYGWRSAKDAQKADRRIKVHCDRGGQSGRLPRVPCCVRSTSFSLEAPWRLCFPSELPSWLGGILFRLVSDSHPWNSFTYDVRLPRISRLWNGSLSLASAPSYLGSAAGHDRVWNDIDKLAGDALTRLLPRKLPMRIASRSRNKPLVRGLGSDYSDYMRRTWRLNFRLCN